MDSIRRLHECARMGEVLKNQWAKLGQLRVDRSRQHPSKLDRSDWVEAVELDIALSETQRAVKVQAVAALRFERVSRARAVQSEPRWGN
jgi:hypothetical protein